ncbi:MAG: acetyl-CoA carboxylase, carboxyltransferase subunit beta [Rhodothermales bacterium]|nr:acetyl-CoA carboxylase, carboxyltransferase subunit beta [Rhodothermales bacterium]
MTWFKRQKAGIQTDLRDQMAVPEGQWTKCPECSEPVHRRELREQLLVCPKCSYHFKMPARGYFDILFDDGEYQLHDDDLLAVDRLGFVDRKSYSDRLVDARKKTGLGDGALAATGLISGREVSVGAMDFSFIGGSMGSVVGEILSRAIKRAYDRDTPLIIIAQSGGARMMEGALSLMQMAKTSAQLARLAEKSLPYFVLLTNPTTGGVTASFAMLGDIHLAEPGALIGFAGPRVIRETMGQDLPDGFQTAEFLKDHGFVDSIVDRRVLRRTVIDLLDLILEDQ